MTRKGSWAEIAEDVRTRCAPAGLDLVQPFQVGWYNAVVDDAYRLPDFGRRAALGLLIGNTRALWPRFVDALRAEPTRLADRKSVVQGESIGAGGVRRM